MMMSFMTSSNRLLSRSAHRFCSPSLIITFEKTSFSTIIHRSLYNLALTRQVPHSFVDSLSHYAQDSEPISIERATQQHKDYVSLLRTKIPTLDLPPLEAHPDGTFVEDTVVAVQNCAVITNPGHVSRQGEVESIQLILEQLGMQIVSMEALNPNAICDGGDVLTTGRHMFVGLSNRTNQEGAAILQDVFGGGGGGGDNSLEVIPVPMDSTDALHLKSIVTHLDEHTLLAPIGMAGDKLLQAMKAHTLGYQIVRLPDMVACNVVSVNGMILASTAMSQQSKQLLQAVTDERNMELCFVETSEINKADGACTCCSVLLSL